MEITAKIKIKNVNLWGVNWSNKAEKEKQLKELKEDINRSLVEHCGIALESLDIELELDKEYGI